MVAKRNFGRHKISMGSDCTTRETRHRLAAVLAALLAACSGPPTPPVGPTTSWEAQLAEAQVARAEVLAGQVLAAPPPDPNNPPEGGFDASRAAARREARTALASARHAAHPAASARALLVIGRLDGDVGALTEALAMFEGLHDTEGASAARLELAMAAIQAGQPAAALAWLAPLPTDPTAGPRGDTQAARVQSSHATALVNHLLAAALRLAGDPEEALARERQASLALSLAPDTELLSLRRDVAQCLADDYSRAMEFQSALEQHARAAALARLERNRRAELSALSGLCGDLAGLGRFKDAVDHCSRALTLAEELQDRVRARDLARAGLALLGALGESHETERWRAFDAAAR